jgi:probable 2-oxoglutarate dehydrogenase E1 component DHKTD1
VSAGVSSIVLSLPHRGRLSLLCDPSLLALPPTALFAKIKGQPEFDPSTAPGASGDVISHLAATREIPYNEGEVKVEILQNPSHLEVSSSLLDLLSSPHSVLSRCQRGVT